MFLGSNTFTVSAGTAFFVPLFTVDDSPPVLGTFPATHQQALGYFFDVSQVGAHHFGITIDGESTPIGPAYLAGPATVAPLPDGGGTHIISLGAFLPPLTPGTHSVQIFGGVFGALVAQTFGLAFDEESIDYTVKVLAPA